MKNKKQEINIQTLKDEIKLFHAQQNSLVLSTITTLEVQQHEPLASYAPFVEIDLMFYCLLSNLASHSVNLNQHQLENTEISILLIEDESLSRNVFARKRLSYKCSVTKLAREDMLWQEVIKNLRNKLGKTIDLISGLSDFQLYCFKPLKGHYVRGFGQAYELKDAREPILTALKKGL